MADKPAARVTDPVTCPLASPVPHSVPPGNPIKPPGGPTVMIGDLPAARVGDLVTCLDGAENPIRRGAFPVALQGRAAARLADPATHAGSVIAPPCEPTVLIGPAGISGNPWGARAHCRAMAAGRTPPAGSQDTGGNPIPPNTPGQSYNNCGIESARQLINAATGTNPGQEALLDQALNDGRADEPAVGSTEDGTVVTAANQRYLSGGTYPEDIQGILGSNGVPADTVDASSNDGMEAAVAEGRGVVTFVDAGTLWGPAGGVPPSSGNHWVVTTGVEYDDDGNPINVYVNDTGIGSCAQAVPIATFNNATGGATGAVNPHVVTDGPVW